MSAQLVTAQYNSLSLAETLETTRSVTTEIKDASNNLAVVGAVLQQELPADVQVGEVAQALEQAEELEKKLARSAEKLTQANQALANAIQSQT